MTEYDDSYLEKTLETALADPENYHVPMGITRYDYAKMHGWWVRVYRDRVQFQELFYDSHYPSISEGLRAAILFRHEILTTIPLEKKVAGRHFKTLSPNPEERITQRVEKGKKQPYICWIARYYDEDHKLRTKRFSVGTYGEDGARKKALDFTRKHHNTEPKPESQYPGQDPYQNQKFRVVSREDVEVLASVNSAGYSNKTKEEIAAEESDPFGYEGEEKLQLHRSLERDKKLRDLKVKEYFEKYGVIDCEICSFNFKDTYPFLSKDIIEVHHITPLSQLSGKTKIQLNDLILVCSNCHTAIHQGDEEANLMMALEVFGNENPTNR